MRTINFILAGIAVVALLMVALITAQPRMAAVGAAFSNKGLIVNVDGRRYLLTQAGAYKPPQQPESLANPSVVDVAYVRTDELVAAPGDWRSAWALDLLHRLGNDQPTQGTVDFLIEWSMAEDGGDGAWQRFNVLNTTQSGYGEVGSINDDGVKSFPSYEDGMAATLQTLSYGYYTEIVSGLLANDPERAFNGLIASPWASSHYGYGASWPHLK